MNISFEKFLKAPELLQILTPKDEIFFKSIYEYIERRLLPVKDEIDNEERSATEDDRKGIVVFFPIGLKFYGYSEELTTKMNQRFENCDEELIALEMKMNERLKQLLN